MAEAQYEFSAKQSETLRDLSRKMRAVGLFLVIVGIVHLLVGGLVLGMIYRSQLPAEVAQQISPDVQAQVDAQIKKLPAQYPAWSIAANAMIGGFIFFLLGVWTRSAGGSFARIVTTESRDIEYLMRGLSALNRMYGLVYTLLLLGLLLLLIAVGAGLYFHFV